MGLEKLKKLLGIGSDHYKEGTIEPAEFIAANDLPFFDGNVIKYVTRHRHSKKGLEDLKKARHYIDMILAYEYDWLSDTKEELTPEDLEPYHGLPFFNKP